MILPLSEICAEQNPNPVDQRKRLISLLKSGGNVIAPGDRRRLQE
jgi:hypothetical protein